MWSKITAKVCGYSTYIYMGPKSTYKVFGYSTCTSVGPKSTSEVCGYMKPILPWVPWVQLRCVFPVTTVNFHGSQKPSWCVWLQYVYFHGSQKYSWCVWLQYLHNQVYQSTDEGCVYSTYTSMGPKRTSQVCGYSTYASMVPKSTGQVCDYSTYTSTCTKSPAEVCLTFYIVPVRWSRQRWRTTPLWRRMLSGRPYRERPHSGRLFSRMQKQRLFWRWVTHD